MTAGAPTVYFIDDSATMREVIKIAFRRESINVLACHDAASALAQMEQVRPDVVISDVIMPDKDGYEVCEHIKQHPKLGRTPVILMSGVVNRAVAERAFAVKADELIRKPFQPHDLIGRVKQLLNQPAAQAPPPPAAVSATAALSSIFSAAATGAAARTATTAGPRAVAPAGPAEPAYASPVEPRAPTLAARVAQPVTSLARDVYTPPLAPMNPPPAAAAPVASRGNGFSDLQKLKLEMLRLQGLVRKLQSELEAEREYARALEAHIKTLQQGE